MGLKWWWRGWGFRYGLIVYDDWVQIEEKYAGRGEKA